MRCLTCGAEMSLQQITGEDAAAVSGFERRTFVCSACGDTEQRLAFVKQLDPGEAAVAMDMAPSIAPASFEQSERPARGGIFKRIFANLSVVRDAVERRLVFAGHGRSQTASAHSNFAAQNPVEAEPPLDTADSDSETVSVPAAKQMTAPILLVAESENELDECEALLKRAIEMVQTPGPPPAIPESELEASPGQPEPMAISSHEPQAEVEAPPLRPDSSEAEAASPASDTQIEKTEAAEPEAAAAAPVEPPPARPVTVEIHYDSETSRYIATNTETGLSVLRVADLERLQHMCDRLGWQVVTKPPSTPGQ